MPELPYQVVPLSLFLFFAAAAYYGWKYDRRAIVADAVVVELREVDVKDGDPGDVGYSAVFRFDVDGRSWDVVERPIRVGAIGLKIGQRVTICYPRGDPTRAILYAWWTTPACFVIAVVGLAWLFLDLLARSAPR